MKKIQLHIEIWEEGGMYVAHTHQLDVSSCGHSLDEAKKNIREAVELYLEEAESLGTLNDVLEEAGFTLNEKKEWKEPEMLLLEKVSLAF